MMEAAFMGGGLLGPRSAWLFIGVTNLLSDGSAPAAPQFPSGVQPGDLVVGVMSPRNETIHTAMTSEGWQRWDNGTQDYVCAAKYAPGLAPPRWEKAATNPLYVSVLVFRAPSWSSIKLEAQISPAAPVDITTRAQNELVLSVGITPQTTKGWTGYMPGAVATARVERTLSPAVQVYSANIEYPKQLLGVYVDTLSGAERNLILTAF
jgi:hypothetical protein